MTLISKRIYSLRKDLWARVQWLCMSTGHNTNQAVSLNQRAKSSKVGNTSLRWQRVQNNNNNNNNNNNKTEWVTGLT